MSNIFLVGERKRNETKKKKKYSNTKMTVSSLYSPPRPQVSNIHREEEPLSSLLCSFVCVWREKNTFDIRSFVFSLRQGVSLLRRSIVTLPPGLLFCVVHILFSAFSCSVIKHVVFHQVVFFSFCLEK
jgi:hypothetical protein